MNTAAPYIGIGVVIAVIGMFVAFRAMVAFYVAMPPDALPASIRRVRLTAVVGAAVALAAGIVVLAVGRANSLASVFLIVTVIGMCVAGFEIALLMILALEKVLADRAVASAPTEQT